MPVLEAMAAGAPVLTSNRSALPEVAGDAALLVDPENPDALGTALRDIIYVGKSRPCNVGRVSAGSGLSLR